MTEKKRWAVAVLCGKGESDWISAYVVEAETEEEAEVRGHLCSNIEMSPGDGYRFDICCATEIPLQTTSVASKLTELTSVKDQAEHAAAELIHDVLEGGDSLKDALVPYFKALREEA